MVKKVRAIIFFYGARLTIGLSPISVLVILALAPLLLVSTSIYYGLISIAFLLLAIVVWQRSLSYKNKLHHIPEGKLVASGFSSNEIYLLHLDHSLDEYQKRISFTEQFDLRKWGDKIRITTSFKDFLGFERELLTTIGESQGIFFIGHNDFDHVTLALLRRIKEPFNLVLFDAHADWHNLYPYHLMCGSWVMEAFKSSNIANLFHVGGREGAFDSTDHWWDAAECYGSVQDMQGFIDQQRVSLLPSDRSYNEQCPFDYTRCYNRPLLNRDGELIVENLKQFVEVNQQKLESLPLYIAIDKDVLREEDNIQTWKDGVLSLEHLITVVRSLLSVVKGNVVGMSICGENGPSSYESPFHPGNILELLTKLLYQKNKFVSEGDIRNFSTNDRIIEAIMKRDQL